RSTPSGPGSQASRPLQKAAGCVTQVTQRAPRGASITASDAALRLYAICNVIGEGSTRTGVAVHPCALRKPAVRTTAADLRCEVGRRAKWQRTSATMAPTGERPLPGRAGHAWLRRHP